MASGSSKEFIPEYPNRPGFDPDEFLGRRRTRVSVRRVLGFVLLAVLAVVALGAAWVLATHLF